MRHSLSFTTLFGCVLIVACALGNTAAGQGSSQYPADGESQPLLPTHPAAWVNSNPITQEMLKGKAALLFFYEET